MAFKLLTSTNNQTLNIGVLVIILLGSVFLVTRLWTEIRFWLQSRGNGSRFQGREPLTLPYTVPWIAGAFRMLSPHDMYGYAWSKSSNGRPVKLRVGPSSMYILCGPKNVRTIFQNSKSFSKEDSTLLIFRGSGMSDADVKKFEADTSGTGRDAITDIPDEQRVWKRSHDLGGSRLSNGQAVNVLTAKFIEDFTTELEKTPLHQANTLRLYDFFKRAMGTSSLTALAGTEIFKLNPGLIDMFWDYDEAFLLTAIGFPKILYSKGYKARDRFLEAVRIWVKAAWKNFDKKDEDSLWEPHFGARYTRGMIEVIADAGVSPDGQGSAMLSVLWAINSNAVPCAAWIILEAIQRPGLMERLREEVTPSVTDSSGKLNIDINKLVAESPLLTSMYLECLRTRTSTTVTRTIVKDIECDGYILKSGNYIMSPSWSPNYGSIWNVPGHPAGEFWPERFIAMPKLAPTNPEEKSQYEQAMKPDNFFPYGGGGMVCTGRFFAKQEILAAVALIVMKFDIQPQEWVTHSGKSSKRAANPDEGFAGSGILPPDRDVIVKIRRTV